MRSRVALLTLALSIALAWLAGAALADPAPPTPAPSSDTTSHVAGGDAGVELWGEPNKSTEARGFGKAKGSPYNYKQIAYASAFMALMGAFLIWLIRRNTRDD